MESSRKPPIPVVAAIFSLGNRILVAQREGGAHHNGCWEFPGGKVEPGETPEDALVREIEEEMEVLIEPGGRAGAVTHRYPHIHIWLSAYFVVRWHGAFRLHKHREIRWVTREEALDLELSEADRRLLKELRLG